MKLDTTFMKVFYISLVLWATATFSSISLVALTHVVMLAPTIYFFIKSIRENDYEASSSVKVLMTICLVAVISIAINTGLISNPIKSMSRIKYYVMGFGIVPVLKYGFKNYLTEKRIRLLANIFLVVLIIATLSDILAHMTGFNYIRQKPPRMDGRLSGLFGQTMTYGYLIQFVCLLLVSVLIYRDTLLKFVNSRIFYASFIVSHVGLMGARSRGAIMGYVIGLLVIFFIKSKRVFKYLLASSLAFLFIVLAIVFSGGGKSNLLQKWNSDSNMIRISQYETALYMLKDNPLFGVGYNTFDEQSGNYKEKYDVKYKDFHSHAHSNFFEFLATTGIIGFSLLLLWHVFWFQEIWRLNIPYKSIMSSIFAAFLVSGQFQNTITDSEVMFFFMMLYAITQVKEFKSLES